MAVSDKKKASNAKWDAAHVTRVGAKLRNEQADAFRALCEGAGVSVHGALKAYVDACVRENKIFFIG